MRHGLVTASAVLAGLFAVPAAQAAPLPLSGTLDLADATPAQAVVWNSSQVGGLAGSAVAGIGDFNGDGKPDLAVGEPRRDTPAGRVSGAVHIVLSPATGGRLDDPASVVAITGAAADDRTGFNVHGAGDVNGDGLADVVVGAPDADAGGDRAGVAYVVFGRADRAPIDLSKPFAGFRVGTGVAGDQVGRAVSSIADLNGDGLGEVLVSAPGREGAGRPDAGAVFVVFGRKDTTDVDAGALDRTGGGLRIDGPVGSSAGGALAGRAVASIGDLNGDGRPEILVTAPRGATGLRARARTKGIAYVVWGRPTAGVVDLERLGTDGYSITGTPTTPGEGESSGAQGDFLGESIESVGDVNGDRKPDLVVGAHLADATDRRNSGVAYVLYGKADADPVDVDELSGRGFRLTGVDQDDQTGFDTAAAGDVNGDGVGDIALSSLLAEPLSRPNAGAVYVVFGRRGNQPDLDLAETGTRALRIAGEAAGDTLGFSIDTLGDINGDGGADLVIGATAIDPEYLQNGRSEKAGRVYVVFGASGAVEGSDISTDPGVKEEQARGCRVSTNVQVLMEDNAYTDRSADPRRIRMTGMQAYVSTPRNSGTVLGVTGFSAEEDEQAEPIIEPTLLQPRDAARHVAALARGVDGEDSFPGYPFMARTFANDNPGASARILLVDGYLFRAMRESSGLTAGNPPTYVIAVGSPPERSRSDIRQMQRLARETKGRYFEARTPRGIERALQAIESRLRCDLDAESAFAELEGGEIEELDDVVLEPGAHTADVKLTWRDRRAGFELERIDVIRGGDVVRRISGEAIQQAYAERSTTAPLLGGRGRTFRALHLRGLRAGSRIRVLVRPQGGKRAGRVYGQVTQSRRRR